MSITLLVRLTAKPGQGKDLAGLLRPMPSENDLEGCLGWDVFVNTTNPDEVLILEHWQSTKAHQDFMTDLTKAGTLEPIFKHVESAERTYFVEIQ